MTISAWATLIFVGIVVAFFAVYLTFVASEMFDGGKAIAAKIVIFVVGFGIVFGTYAGLKWYHTETATGRRAVVDERSDLGNGLERTINILNADGEVIRTYTGIIDIEGNDGGYVIFDFNGKRYTYYNCYLESVANIE